MKQRKLPWAAVWVAFVSVFSIGQAIAEGTSEKATATSAVAVTPAGTLPIVKSPVTISAFVVQDSTVQDLRTNLATTELEKRTGIHLDLVIAQGDPSAITEKRNLLLASGDYPEIFFTGAQGGFKDSDILQYGVQQKVLQPLNNLIDKYGVNVNNVFKNYPNLKADLTAPDGNIYGLPQINECYHCEYSQKAWINNAWLQKLGLKMPTTTDEYYNALKAFKTQDPNGNGKADEIPLIGSINSWHNPVYDFFMNAFVYDDGGPGAGGSWFAVNSGKLSFSPAQPGWREGLRYLHKLYADGLIYPASFTQSLQQAEQIGNSPGTEILGAFTAGHLRMVVNLTDNSTNGRFAHWTALPPLKGPNGVQWAATYQGISGANFAITDKAKNPEAAFRLADYVYSPDGTMLMEWGPEGVEWKPAGPNDKGLDGQPAKWVDIRPYAGVENHVQNNEWAQMAPTVRTAAWRANWATNQNALSADGYELFLYQQTKEKYAPYAPTEFYTPVFLQPSQTEQVAQLQTNIQDYVTQSTVQFIVGQKDVDKDWDGYISHLKGLGLDNYIATYQSAYSAAHRAK